MPKAQAEALANYYASLLDDRIAAKNDINSLEQRLEEKIEALFRALGL